jgi:hypothetical protein
VPKDTNAYPHAPWWHDDKGTLARAFDDFVIIPRAELVGLLHHYSALVPDDWLESLTDRTVRDIETIEPLGTGGGDDLVYAIFLAETDALPEAYRERVVRRVRDVTPKAVTTDPQEWDSYCIPPLKLAPTPDSLVADLLQDVLPLNLDHQIDRQTDAGSWDPVWSWGTDYPESWARAEQEWRGHLTLETLTTLRAYDRLA